MYKGIVKVTYDRGYALQTKSLLLHNTTTAFEAVEQLFAALGLRGSPSDYALEERNIVTGGKFLIYNSANENYFDLSVAAKLTFLIFREPHCGQQGDPTQLAAQLRAPVLHGAACGAAEGHPHCPSPCLRHWW